MRVRLTRRGGAADPFLRLEGGATPTRSLDVRVVDGETGSHQSVDEVDLGPGEIRRTEGVDDDPDTVRLDLVVPVLRAAVEAELVLEARAAPTLDCDPKNGDFGLRLVGHELLDLAGCVLSDGDHLNLSVPTHSGWKRGPSL